MNPATSLSPPCVSTLWRRPRQEILPGALALDDGQVHLWVANLDVNLKHHDYYESLLSDREKARVKRLQVKTVADRYVISRGILRELLTCYSGLESDALKFAFGPLGKPSLAPLSNGQTLGFNNTDSRDLAIYAFGWNREIGVDLERLPREVRSAQIASRRFAPSEAAALTALDDATANSTFLACWTRKEAWGKAIGVGIRYDMRSIDLCSDHLNPVMRLDEQGKRWKLMQLRPDENSLACLIADSDHWQPACWQYPGPLRTQT